MQRNAGQLSQHPYDVLIIGGGAFGAAAARDAALRGLRTALIERDDFGAGASAECFKMVHGGIRYLQHADIARLRASCHERTALLRMAPHLVKPLPIAIPTFGHGRRGRAFLGAGAKVYDLLTADRNRGITDPLRRINASSLLSRDQVKTLFPELPTAQLTGAVVFEDGQMHHPARLVLGFVQAAARAGADVCNYLQAQQFLWEGNSVRGALVQDRLSGEHFPIHARLTLNAAGPWADYLLRDEQHFGPWQRLPFSRDAFFVVDRPPQSHFGLALQGQSRDRDAVLGRESRHLFAAPWQDKTLIGVWHRLFADVPDEARISDDELDTWLQELNSVYPRLALHREEICFAHCGLVPFGDTATEQELSFGKQSRLIDHRYQHGVQSLVSLTGIRFTMARADATQALDLLLSQSDRPEPVSLAGCQPLPGGDIDDFAAFVTAARRDTSARIDDATLHSLLHNHGSRYPAVLASAPQDIALDTVPDSTTLVAEIHHAVTREMAVHLADVVFRRTDMAAGHHPGAQALAGAAAVMAPLLGWSDTRRHQEIQDTERLLHRHHARVTRRTAASVTSPAPANGAMLHAAVLP